MANFQFSVYKVGKVNSLLAEKQDVLTAGEGISLDSDNKISTTGWTQILPEEMSQYIDSEGNVLKSFALNWYNRTWFFCAGGTTSGSDVKIIIYQNQVGQANPEFYLYKINNFTLANAPSYVSLSMVNWVGRYNSSTSSYSISYGGSSGFDSNGMKFYKLN